jgi:hypothetical protein
MIQESTRDVLSSLLLEKRERTFFHTTSFKSLPQILKSMQLKPKNIDNPFVSFSEVPYFGDISGNDVVLAFKLNNMKPQLLQVEYDEDFYERYREQAAYIAGEGWREQFIIDDYVDPDDYDEWGDIDPDVEEAAYREAELASFEAKSGEREWVSKREGQPVKFKADDVAIILVKNAALTNTVKEMVDKLGLNIEVGALGGRPRIF